MHVLIVGAKGQLGQDLIAAFHDCEITPYDIEDMDITDEAAVQQHIASLAPDLVINSAAFTRVDECEKEHLLAFKVNALGPLHLAQACQRWKIPLVHISTNYVFDGAKEQPYVECDTPIPLNAYGITKLAGEHYVHAACDQFFTFRVAGLFGLTPSRMKGTNFIEAMLRLGTKGTPLRVVSDEILSPTYTKDAAAAIRQVVATEEFGLYHLCNTGCCSWFEFAQEIFHCAGMDVQLEKVTAKEYGAPARRPKNSCLVSQRMNTLGFDPMPAWQDAVARYLDERKKCTSSFLNHSTALFRPPDAGTAVL